MSPRTAQKYSGVSRRIFLYVTRNEAAPGVAVSRIEVWVNAAYVHFERRLGQEPSLSRWYLARGGFQLFCSFSFFFRAFTPNLKSFCFSLSPVPPRPLLFFPLFLRCSNVVSLSAELLRPS